MPRIGREAPTGNAAEFSWSRVRANCSGNSTTTTTNSNSLPHPPSSGYGIRHENVTQDGDIRHENVIVVDVIRQENVISPCMSGNIFAKDSTLELQLETPTKSPLSRLR